MTSEHFDGIVVGSGLSGVDAAAYHLQTATKSHPRSARCNRRPVGPVWLSGHPF
jgi:cation diffusion facilitator CzcD-associated flavoprotein CzcO